MGCNATVIQANLYLRPAHAQPCKLDCCRAKKDDTFGGQKKRSSIMLEDLTRTRLHIFIYYDICDEQEVFKNTKIRILMIIKYNIL